MCVWVCGGRGVFLGRGVVAEDLFVVEVQLAVDRGGDVCEGPAGPVVCEIGEDLLADG